MGAPRDPNIKGINNINRGSLGGYQRDNREGNRTGNVDEDDG